MYYRCVLPYDWLALIDIEKFYFHCKKNKKCISYFSQMQSSPSFNYLPTLELHIMFENIPLFSLPSNSLCFKLCVFVFSLFT